MAIHFSKRGNRYQYARRVPADLLHRFPSPVIVKSLKTSTKKHAAALSAAYDYRAEQLFSRLRTAMLDAVTEKYLIHEFLRFKLDELEGIATGHTHNKEAAGAIDYYVFEAEWLANKKLDVDNTERNDYLASIADRDAEFAREWLAKKELLSECFIPIIRLAQKYKAEYGIHIPESQVIAMALQLQNQEAKVHSAAAAIFRGDWSLYEAMRENNDAVLSQPLFMFSQVIERYQEWFRASKVTVKAGTIADMEVECRVLLEIIGNKSIAAVNTMDTVTALKSVLRRYPLNRVQRYGDKPIQSILRSASGYDVISPKTANEYLKRLKALIDFAAKNKMVNAANVVVGELFNTAVAAEDARSAYDDEDIEKLIDALCTQQLWGYGDPKPERFWIVLIALFHGLRLGNIVALRKDDITQTSSGLWLFNLRHGKTQSTVRRVAICDALILLGFLEWVDSLKREKLFQDTSDSFSKWFNRDEVRATGHVAKGFEASYVTTDKKKCLYSLRHNFAGNVFDVTGDFKLTSDMMGHSTGRSVTARYTKRTKEETLKQITELMSLRNVDLDRLEQRAKELFFTNAHRNI